MCADIWGCESHKMIYIKHHLINITYCHHPVIIWERKQRKVMGEIINSFLSGSVALKFSLFLSSFESSEECVYLFLLFLWGSWWSPQAVILYLSVYICKSLRRIWVHRHWEPLLLPHLPFSIGPPSGSLELKLANTCHSASKDNIRPSITPSLNK